MPVASLMYIVVSFTTKRNQLQNLIFSSQTQLSRVQNCNNTKLYGQSIKLTPSSDRYAILMPKIINPNCEQLMEDVRALDFFLKMTAKATAGRESKVLIDLRDSEQVKLETASRITSCWKGSVFFVYLGSCRAQLLENLYSRLPKSNFFCSIFF